MERSKRVTQESLVGRRSFCVDRSWARGAYEGSHVDSRSTAIGAIAVSPLEGGPMARMKSYSGLPPHKADDASDGHYLNATTQLLHELNERKPLALVTARAQEEAIDWA